jgi:hypothetical protein
MDETTKRRIKKRIEPPEEDKKVFAVSFDMFVNHQDRCFQVGCYEFAITKRLALIVPKDSRLGYNFIYSKKDLLERRFELADVIKFIHGIQEHKLASFHNCVPISFVLANL